MVSSMAVMDPLEATMRELSLQMKRFVTFSMPEIVLTWLRNRSFSSFKPAEGVRINRI